MHRVVSLTALIFAAASAVAEPRAVIHLTGITPRGAPALGTLEGVSDYGGVFSTLENTTIPINPTTDTAVNASVYFVTISNLDLSSQFAGATDLTVTFELKLTASAGDGLAVNGGVNRTWVVDDSGTTGNINDRVRFATGETIRFEVLNVGFSGTAGTVGGVSFDKFTGATWAGDALITGTFDLATGLATGSGPVTSASAATRLDTLALDLVAVPEPASWGLISVAAWVGLVGIRTRQHRRLGRR